MSQAIAQTNLPALFDLLHIHVVENPTMEPLERTNLPLADPRWVAAALGALKTHGFTFRFMSPAEEQRTNGADGLCSWFKVDATGTLVPDRVMLMNRRANSLDAFAVAAHELGHVYTLDPEQVRVATADPRYTSTPFYAHGEVLAEAVAFVVAAAVVPEHTTLLLRRSVTYLTHYLSPTTWHEKNLVLDAAYTILTDAAERLETL